ncbi:MAG: uroporphyrinogen-III C-methyltransferase [Candidatus Omnitrophota bacterium]
MNKVKVYLVGAGPGGNDLITVRGLNTLREADVVIYDYLVDRKLLQEAKEGAELICCDKLRKNRYSDGFLIHQEKINKLLVKKAREGKKVVRLKNGDPVIFGRLSQELEALLKNRIEFEVIPGVTAASVAAGLSGIPLTDRRFASSCVFVTGHEDPSKRTSLLDWNSISKVGTIVLYMAVENVNKIVKKLINAGKNEDAPVAIVKDAGLLTQKVLTGTLGNIVTRAKEQNIKPPAIIIIGEVVKLEKEFNWLKKNKRILFTGISPQRFFEKGTIFHQPLIKMEPLNDYKEFDKEIRSIDGYDWIIFSSRYGVQYFFQRLYKIGYDTRRLSEVKIAAIGNSTRNWLLDFGVIADVVPKEESSKGLINEFKKIDIRNRRIFLPRSDISDKGLAQGLSSLGAKVTSCVAYKNVMPDNLPDLDLRFFDEVMFTSPSGVRNFVKRYGTLPKSVKVRCIGDVTFKEARRWHLLG